MTIAPEIAAIIAKYFPIIVYGTISPYPTVVIVTKMKYTSL
jgi:hypothetical protein